MTVTFPNIGEDISKLYRRVYSLEQRLGDPSVVGVTPSNLVLDSVTVGGVVLSGNPVASPTDLTLTPGAFLGNSYIDVSWTPSNLADSYEVLLAKRNDDGSTFQTVTAMRSYITSLRFNNLDGLSVYGVSVVAIDRVGNRSQPVPAVGFAITTTVKDNSVPGPVFNINVTSGATSATVTWDENPEDDVRRGAGTYEIQMDTVNTFNSPDLDNRSQGGTIITYTGLVPGTRYYWRVRAIDSSDNAGPWSDPFDTIPGGVGGSVSDGVAPASSPVPVITGMVGALYVRWTAVTNPDPVTYVLHLSEAGPSFEPTASTQVGEFQGTVGVVRNLPGTSTPLTPGTTYWIRIVAKDADGAANPGTAASGSINLIGTNDLGTGIITAESGIIASLDAGVITVGQMHGDRISAETIDSSKIVAIGLDAQVIKFGFMSGDRINANTIDVGRLKTSALTSTTITLGPGGQFLAGNPPTTGLAINDQGVRLYKAGSPTVILDTPTGNASFINANFSGTITGSVITGSQIVGGSVYGGTVSTSNQGPEDGNYASMRMFQRNVPTDGISAGVLAFGPDYAGSTDGELASWSDPTLKDPQNRPIVNMRLSGPSYYKDVSSGPSGPSWSTPELEFYPTNHPTQPGVLYVRGSAKFDDPTRMLSSFYADSSAWFNDIVDMQSAKLRGRDVVGATNIFNFYAINGVPVLKQYNAGGTPWEMRATVIGNKFVSIEGLLQNNTGANMSISGVYNWAELNTSLIPPPDWQSGRARSIMRSAQNSTGTDLRVDMQKNANNSVTMLFLAKTPATTVVIPPTGWIQIAFDYVAYGNIP